MAMSLDKFLVDRLLTAGASRLAKRRCARRSVPTVCENFAGKQV